MDGQEQAALVVTQVSVDGLERQAQVELLVGVELQDTVDTQEHQVTRASADGPAQAVTQVSAVGLEHLASVDTQASVDGVELVVSVATAE